MTPSKVEFTLFGSPQFLVDGERVEGFATRKTQALLMYLVCNRRALSRDLLAGMFWGDKPETDARNNLRRVLPELRRRFGDYLAADRQAIRFDRRASFWLDVDEFTAALAMIRNAPLDESDIDRLEAALALYSGEFLAGFNLPDAPGFEEWVTFQREHLRELALRGLSFITEHFVQTHQIRRGLAASQRLLALEPWHESAYQQRMILLAWNGERAAALHHYDLCKQMLAAEFGLLPGRETADLYARIRAGELDPPDLPAEAPAADVPGIESVPRQPLFVGRSAELAQLREWHQRRRSAVIAVLGVGGTGKTALVTRYVRESGDQASPPPFDRVLWVSLLNAPPLASLLRIWLRALAVQAAAELPDDVDELLALLFPHLRSQRCLLVLDNLESLLEDGPERGNFRSGYKAYARLLQRMAELPHASTLILTSRELPAGLARTAGEGSGAVRTLALGGLPSGTGAELLAGAGLRNDAPAIDKLVRHYSGNPLALKLVAETVRELYAGDLDAFLAHGMPVFGDIRAVLDEQTARLTELEREILGWLAIEREPVAVNKVLTSLVGPLDRHAVLHAMNTLLHTSLVERAQDEEEGEAMRLTLQNVVMEYVTDRLLRAFGDDLAQGAGDTMRRYPLVIAGAPEYIQTTQRRLLLQPVVDEISRRWGTKEAIARVRARLEQLRQAGLAATGYAAANVLHLLLALGADLRNLDLSHLAVWKADLRAATLTGVDFTGADLAGSVFAGTFGAVNSLAVSPDGRFFAAAGSDGAVHLWRYDGIEMVNTLRRHTLAMTVEFSADGRLLLSSGLDGLICLWDVASGSLAGSIETPERPIICATLHPDGAHVATAGTDETIRVWEWRSATLRGALRAPSVLTGLAYSPDGETLVSIGDEATICLWDAHTDALRAIRHGHSGKVESVAFHPDGAIFATGGADGRICLWDLHTPAPQHTLEGHTDFVLSLAFSPDGQWLASCGADQTARLWDVATTTLQRVLTGHRGWVNAVVFAADGRTVITGGYDQSVRLWNTNTGRQEHLLKGHLRWVDFLAFSNDGCVLASCSLDGPVRLWDATTGDLVHTLRGPEAATRILTFSRRGDLLATAGDDQKVRIWDVRSGALLQTLRGHKGSVRNVLISPDGCAAISAGHDGTLRVWNVTTGEMTRVVAGISATNRHAIAFDPTHRLLAYGTLKHTVVLEDVVTTQPVFELNVGEAEPDLVAFDPSGRWLAVGSNNGAVLVYRLGGESLPTALVYAIPPTGAPVWRLLFSPDSAMLASIRTDQSLQLLDLTTGAVTATLATYFGAFCLAFSRDGAQMVTDGPDHSLLLRDTRTCAVDHVLSGHRAAVTCIEVSPRDNRIASSSVDGSIRLWELASGACTATLEVQDPYAGMTVTDVRGITLAQRESLLHLGARLA